MVETFNKQGIWHFTQYHDVLCEKFLLPSIVRGQLQHSLVIRLCPFCLLQKITKTRGWHAWWKFSNSKFVVFIMLRSKHNKYSLLYYLLNLTISTSIELKMILIISKQCDGTGPVFLLCDGTGPGKKERGIYCNIVGCALHHTPHTPHTQPHAHHPRQRCMHCLNMVENWQWKIATISLNLSLPISLNSKVSEQSQVNIQYFARDIFLTLILQNRNSAYWPVGRFEVLWESKALQGSGTKR